MTVARRTSAPRLDAEPAVPRRPRTLPELLAAHERILIIEALSRAAFSRRGAAQILGVSRNYLWRRVKILGIKMAELPAGPPAGRGKKNN